MKNTKVLLEKGTGKTAEIQDVEIPDLWHIAMSQPEPYKSMIVETWHLAHAMKAHIVAQQEG